MKITYLLLSISGFLNCVLFIYWLISGLVPYCFIIVSLLYIMVCDPLLPFSSFKILTVCVCACVCVRTYVIV